MTTATAIITERSSRRFWLTMILLLMSVNLGIAAYAIVMAVGDNSLRPIPGYNAQAVSWQERHELFQQSASLGWQYRPISSDGGLEIKLTDKKNEPVEGCLGSIRAFHFTAAGQVVQSEVKPSESGVYRADLDLSRPGLWKVMLDLTGPNGEHFVTDDAWNCRSDGTMERAKSTR